MATASETPSPASSPTPAPTPVAAPAPAAASAPIDSASKVTAAPAKPPFLHHGQPLPIAPKAPAAAQGWWSVRGIKGARADVIKAVQAMPEIPAHWQAALATEITNHSAETGKIVLHVDISPLEGFVGDGAVMVDAHFVKQNANGAAPKGPVAKRSS